MSTTYGAPTGLDLSACSVTATGGTTSQTIADLAKSVADANTNIATAVQNASSANTAAQAAQTTANSAQTAISNLGNTYIPQTSIGAKSGVAGLDPDGNIVVYREGYGSTNSVGGTAYVFLGNNSDNKWTAGSQYGAVQFGNGGNAGNPVTINTWGDGTGRQLAMDANAVHPASDNATNLGSADHAWSNVYSKTAVQVTSDATQKTVIGSLGDTSYTDGQKLAAALFGLDTSMFQLNASIAEKGADKARLHAGFIAQQVESAITAAGLDPEKFALWTKSPVYDVVQKPTGEKDANGKPITVATSVAKTDNNGNQIYTQMLRYEQILCVLFEAAKQKIASQESALSALTTRVAALEAKAGA